MEPNNPMDNPTGQVPNPGMPQPLNTSAQMPTGMPMEPTQPLAPQGVGLPSQLPGTPEVSKTGGSSKMLWIIGIIVLILVVLGGGYYFYTNTNKEISKSGSTKSQPDAGLTSLETELKSIEITDPEGDLAEVDQEIGLLEATPSSR